MFCVNILGQPLTSALHFNQVLPGFLFLELSCCNAFINIIKPFDGHVADKSVPLAQLCLCGVVGVLVCVCVRACVYVLCVCVCVCVLCVCVCVCVCAKFVLYDFTGHMPSNPTDDYCHYFFQQYRYLDRKNPFTMDDVVPSQNTTHAHARTHQCSKLTVKVNVQVLPNRQRLPSYMGRRCEKSPIVRIESATFHSNALT